MTTTADGQKRLMRQKIESDPAAAFRVLVAIWKRQTRAEQFTHVHGEHDGKGFTEWDTADANALYERFESAGFMWQRMSAIDVVRCQRMMQKYARQYLLTEVDARDRDIQRFKINKHPKREKLSKGDREQIIANIEKMETQHEQQKGER